MSDQFSRTRLLLGADAMDRLAACRVAVFGVGGVGGYAVEALARSGIGALDLIDSDRVSLSNLNRQLYALHSTVGRYKVDVAEERIHDINPDCTVRTYKIFYLPETQAQFDFSAYDYVVDAIDTVSGKLALAKQAQEAGTPVISAMGAGNKLDPAAVRVADIQDTSVCPLARIMRGECRKRGIMRKECRKRGIGHLKVVYSAEMPVQPEKDPSGLTDAEKAPGRRAVPGSVAYVPSAAGLIIAGEVIRDLTKGRGEP